MYRLQFQKNKADGYHIFREKNQPKEKSRFFKLTVQQNSNLSGLAPTPA